MPEECEYHSEELAAKIILFMGKYQKSVSNILKTQYKDQIFNLVIDSFEKYFTNTFAAEDGNYSHDIPAHLIAKLYGTGLGRLVLEFTHKNDGIHGCQYLCAVNGSYKGVTIQKNSVVEIIGDLLGEV